MNVKVTNLGASKITLNLNPEETKTILPGVTISTYTNPTYLPGLKDLAKHKIWVRREGEVITKRKPSRRRIVLSDRSLKKIKALKLGIVRVDSRLRKYIAKLEIDLLSGGKVGISRFMNLLAEQTDEDVKIGIFKKLIEQNLLIRQGGEP